MTQIAGRGVLFYVFSVYATCLALIALSAGRHPAWQRGMSTY